MQEIIIIVVVFTLPNGSWVRMVLPLPRIGEDQRLTVLARPGLRDPSTTSMDDMMKVVLLTLDLIQEEEETLGIVGFQLLLDAGEMTFAHASQMTPPLMKKFSTLLQVLDRSVFSFSGIACHPSLRRVCPILLGEVR